ncbi:MAG: hypothetical protein EBT77_08480 [Verrucomicrobia bacterium]|nr:hypothetical protein [Verrucomicrobiota bacterium]
MSDTTTANIGGRDITFDPFTDFVVQVGKGKSGSYKTRYVITGDLRQALFYYAGINIGFGYKKRLIAPKLGSKPLLQAWA